jgi:hypothetical protein
LSQTASEISIELVSLELDGFLLQLHFKHGCYNANRWAIEIIIKYSATTPTANSAAGFTCFYWC